MEQHLQNITRSIPTDIIKAITKNTTWDSFLLYLTNDNRFLQFIDIMREKVYQLHNYNYGGLKIVKGHMEKINFNHSTINIHTKNALRECLEITFLIIKDIDCPIDYIKSKKLQFISLHGKNNRQFEDCVFSIINSSVKLCHVLFENLKITGATWDALARNNVKYLILDHVATSNKEKIIDAFQKMKNIEYLEIATGCSTILELFLQNKLLLPKLKTLQISLMDGAPMSRLLLTYPNLTDTIIEYRGLMDLEIFLQKTLDAPQLKCVRITRSKKSDPYHEAAINNFLHKIYRFRQEFGARGIKFSADAWATGGIFPGFQDGTRNHTIPYNLHGTGLRQNLI